MSKGKKFFIKTKEESADGLESGPAAAVEIIIGRRRIFKKLKANAKNNKGK